MNELQVVFGLFLPLCSSMKGTSDWPNVCHASAPGKVRVGPGTLIQREASLTISKAVGNWGDISKRRWNSNINKINACAVMFCKRQNSSYYTSNYNWFLKVKQLCSTYACLIIFMRQICFLFMFFLGPWKLDFLNGYVWAWGERGTGWYWFWGILCFLEK